MWVQCVLASWTTCPNHDAEMILQKCKLSESFKVCIILNAIHPQSSNSLGGSSVLWFGSRHHGATSSHVVPINTLLQRRSSILWFQFCPHFRLCSFRHILYMYFILFLCPRYIVVNRMTCWYPPSHRSSPSGFCVT